MKQSDNEKMGKIKKFFRLYMFPVVLSVAIIGAVVFGSYDTARATGMEEFFYYTYFDLISGLFAETGQQFSLKDEFYTKSDRVSGKQVWNNFCTWVEEKAKTLALPVEVVNKTVFDEFKDLPNKVTSAGVTMSEKLSELLAKVLPTFSDKDGLSDYGDSETTYAFIRGVMGITDAYSSSGGTYSLYDLWTDLKNGYELNIIKYGDFTLAFATSPDYADFKIQLGPWGYAVYYKSVGETYSMFRNHVGFTANSATLKTSSQDLESISSIEPVWIMKKGKFTVSDGTTVKDYAKVKTVDDNTVYVPGVGYKTNWDILKDILNDRVTADAEEEAWNSRYNFDKDNKDDKEKKKKDNEKDKLPVAIPIVFPNKKPDSTEKDTEKDTESGVPGKDPSKNPMINPDTGRYIDPDTGYDIDPDTGKLIDPDTGELIDPNIPSIADKAGNWKRLFPFCIPWDMMELVKTLKADKKAPRFTFKYTFEKINYTWVVDVNMADYWKYIKIFRWGMTIFFIIGLFFLTAKITTFVHRMSG
jgi:hypothetical protein